MSNILFLVHRLPYPPNKGDKVRSYHLLKHLAARHRVFLGTFVDDPEDEVHIAALPPFCADLRVERLSPRWAKLRSLAGLLSNEALTLPFYRNRRLQAWVNRTLATQQIDAVVIFSSAMAQYVQGAKVPVLVDFVDVDSAKWTQYAGNHRWPMSWLYRREGERLLAFERTVAQRSRRSFFVTDNEVALFRKAAPESVPVTEAICNGVDAEFFSPEHALASPYPAGEVSLVFTGAMDYWPNVDAVTWFCTEVLPSLLQRWPGLKFYIVGRSPTQAVQALASPQVVVTGTVPDVRPYLRHATLVVAPLRVARGIQNKVLEAMAMSRPVLASQTCAAAVDAQIGRDLLAADSVGDYVRQVEAVLASPEQAEELGIAARRQVLARYSWDAHLAGMDRYLDSQDAISSHAVTAVPADAATVQQGAA
ncbi:TIGR03087 family PEP-CTERM/XrtA system glycosyltransferase [Chitinimonas sp.]|uniref:TIGR03087 family PEP-CTERM/XrtA system glycosyltransferase n=1 Tax=Chitinimonas sp. TaxID=1934313 RepID=UPI002F92B82B